MPRYVTMVAEIIDEKCTGCDLCIKVCPTLALRLRDRRADEPGRGKKIAEIEEGACYNVQNCLEICPHDAILMRELEKPFEVKTDVSQVDPQAIEALCAKAGFPPATMVCYCTGTTMAEMAAAILLGADSPEKVSLATGARTGCAELCIHALLSLLHAAGHGDVPRNPANGYQWYGMCGTLFSNLGPDGTLPAALAETFKNYPVNRELSDMHQLQQAAMARKNAKAQAE